MTEYIIIKNGNWYNFKGIAQEDNYIIIENLCCMTDRKAINQAKRILKDNYKECDKIVIKK